MMDVIKRKTLPTVPPVTITVTAASTEISRMLLLMIAKGELLGKATPMNLYLVESKSHMGALQHGVFIELQMCNLTLVRDMKCTEDLELAVSKADYIFLVNGVMPNPNLSRRDMLSSNALEYKNIGMVLEKVRNITAKILIVNEPQNINMAVCCHFAPSLDPKKVSALSRVDHNRSVSKLAKILGISCAQVTHMSVWGNSGGNFFPDVRHAKAVVNGRTVNAYDAVGNDYYLKYDFIHDIMVRSEEVFKKRNSGASLTTANAAVQHMKDWVHGTPAGEFTSMIVMSDGSYDINPGLPYSFPVIVNPSGLWEIVHDLELDLFEKERLEDAKESIMEEKLFVDTVMGIVEKKTDEQEGQPPPWSFGTGKVIPCKVLGALERDRMALF